MDRAIRIVTYNTWKCDGHYHNRLTWMTEGLLALSPDIVCLQEAFVCAECGADTAAHFATHLGLAPTILPSRYKRRTFEGASRMSWSNLVLLTKYPAVRGPDEKLAEHMLDDDRWVMQVELSLGNNLSIQILNTHLTHIHGEAGELLRRTQAEQLGRLCSESTEDIVVLCGDLNADWDEPCLAPLRHLEWLPPKTETSGGTRIGERVAESLPDRRIDHIQILQSGSVTGQLVRRFPALNKPVGSNGEFPSDHAALVVDYLLTDPSRKAA